MKRMQAKVYGRAMRLRDGKVQDSWLDYAYGAVMASLLIIGMGGAWIVGDARQDAAREAEQAALTIEQKRLEAEIRVEREEALRRSPDVWKRICEDGLNYVDGACK